MKPIEGKNRFVLSRPINNLVCGIICSSLVLLFLSCFSSEKNTTPTTPEIEKRIVKQVETEQKNIVPEENETEENTKAEEPIRMQSTLTPTVVVESSNPPMTSNTAEVQVSEEKAEVSESQAEPHQKTSAEIDSEEQKGTETPDPANQVKIGMSFEEVVRLLGKPDSLITQSPDKQMKLYRWNRTDRVLYGRFENGILKRYSGKLAEEGSPTPLTRELYDQLKEGMELDEVVAILQRPGTQVSSDKQGGVLYLWTDRGGSSFSARFENNKLVRKSGFYIKPAPIKEEIKGETETIEEEASPSEEELPTETEEAVEEDENIYPQNTGQETIPQEENITTDSNNYIPQSKNESQSQAIHNNRRIVYAGKRVPNEEKNTQVMNQTTIKRKVKLPDYTYNLRDGSYEIKIYNPLDTSVKVGLRSGKRGKNISIPAGGVKSVKVPRGEYQFWYIRDDEPSELQQGGNVQIDGLFVGDVEVMLLK